MKNNAGLLFKLQANTANNTNLIGRLFDMKDQGRKDEEFNYRRDLRDKKREHKEEFANLKEQYEVIVEEK